MLRHVSVCRFCDERDLSQAIVCPIISAVPHNHFIRGQQGSFPWCDQLTRLLRTSFGDKETENLLEDFTLHHLHLSHPALTYLRATFFWLKFNSNDNGLSIYLLPVQARFVDFKSGEHTYLPCGRTVEPSSVDYDMFNKCIKQCQSEHTTMCGSSIRRDFTPTRLIDCKKRVLCSAPNRRYTCLSYVWGDESAEDAASNNQILADVPKTVLDAMFVTLKLGMRYLWVDRYCIDQNNPEEKHNAIRNMNSIYRNAFVTIVAAAGNSSDYGLPGVSRPRKATSLVKIGSHAFVAVRNPSTDIQTSIWYTRGWTYQEMLLSRRRLIFTDHQVYFQCSKHQTMEKLDRTFQSTELINLITKNTLFLPTQGGSFNINDIYIRLQEYYPRTLRYETDNINAFDGIFRELSDRTSKVHCVPERGSKTGLYMARRNPHFYGIPLWLQDSEVPYDTETSELGQPLDMSEDDMVSLRFGINLGWKIATRGMEVPSTDGGDLVKPTFPSWSWASTKDSNHRHSRRQISYDVRPDVISSEIQDAKFIASVTHVSGKHMSMRDYTAQTDDYTLFHPW